MNTQKATPRGATPAIVLEDPKVPKNVGLILRAAFNFGFKQLWITGNRVGLYGTDSYRLPFEERFKEYRQVELIGHDKPLTRFPRGTSVIGVELHPGAMSTTWFEHPDNAVYVFGPEDGRLSKGMRAKCHQIIFLPTLSCLNLAMAVTAVLTLRQYKAQVAGKEPVRSMEETLSRYQSSGERDIDELDYA